MIAEGGGVIQSLSYRVANLNQVMPIWSWSSRDIYYTLYTGSLPNDTISSKYVKLEDIYLMFLNKNMEWEKYRGSTSRTLTKSDKDVYLNKDGDIEILVCVKSRLNKIIPLYNSSISGSLLPKIEVKYPDNYNNVDIFDHKNVIGKSICVLTDNENEINRVENQIINNGIDSVDDKYKLKRWVYFLLKDPVFITRPGMTLDQIYYNPYKNYRKFYNEKSIYYEKHNYRVNMSHDSITKISKPPYTRIDMINNDISFLKLENINFISHFLAATWIKIPLFDKTVLNNIDTGVSIYIDYTNKSLLVTND